MKTFILLTLVAGLFAAKTQARIGYTLDQCVKEYGPYKMRQSWCGTVYDFHVNDERVTVVMLKDVVSAIDYIKPDGTKFDVTEIDDLLDKNKGSSVWGAPYPNIGDGTQHVWLTTGGPELVANETPGSFSVSTKTQRILDADLAAKQERDSLATEEGAKRYVERFFESVGETVTVSRCGAFVPKIFANVSYLLGKALVTFSGSSNQDAVGIIVQLDKDQRLMHTYSLGENDFYQFVTTGDTALLPHKVNLDVNAKPSPTPEANQEDTAKRDKLKQLVAVPTSDMSSLSREEVKEAAQLDAQSYFATHRQKVYDSNIGEARALKHNLLGSLALAYEVSLEEALKALATADAPGN